MKPLGDTTFWSYVDKHTSECWLWTGALNSGGYGLFGRPSGTRIAHRLAYEDAVCPIPDGLHLDHLCCVRKCVNPSHLEAVTQAENNRRMREALPDPAHCRNGHSFGVDNFFLDRFERKNCRTCARSRSQKYRDRQHKTNLRPSIAKDPR